ncbi:MAG TPA: glycosyltransferase, partial [Anaeromyxobacteraceae bacterium]
MEHATAGIRDEAARAEAQGSADGGRPLRVAMLASMFPPSIGGIQIHTLRLSQKLVERGLDVHVVTRIQPGLAPFERMCGVRVHRVGLPA